jgi:hypothetical protein
VTQLIQRRSNAVARRSTLGCTARLGGVQVADFLPSAPRARVAPCIIQAALAAVVSK